MNDIENDVIDVEPEKPDQQLQQVPRGNMELAIAGALEWTPDKLEKQIEQEKQMRAMIVKYTQDAMIEGHHYYKITKDGKPAVSKEGAYNLRSLFKVTPGPREITKEWHGDGHLTVIARSPLYDRAGNLVATGDGLATTRESKWAYRNAERVCPDCGAGAIIKGKAEYGGGWLCWKNKGGCGAKFTDNDKQITDQEIGKVENENLADLYNTVLKIAGKRADVDAALQLPLVSELFTQDVDESHIARAVGIKPNNQANDEPPSQPKQSNRQRTGQAVKEAAKRQADSTPTHTGPQPDDPAAKFATDLEFYFGNSGPAFKKYDEIMGLCKKLNEAGHATKWSFKALAEYVQDGFDKAIKQLDENEVNILIQDLTDTLNEHLAIKHEGESVSTPTGEQAKPPKGTIQPADDDPVTPNQVDALSKFCDIKDTTEIEVMLAQFPNGEKTEFAQMTFGEGKKALQIVGTWKKPEPAE